jgi:hypothetical protein
MTPNENAAPGWLPGSGVENNCACHFSPASAPPSMGPAPTLARVIPLAHARRVGGPSWRRQHGLLTWRDMALEYSARRFIRPGALMPLPEDLLPAWREVRREPR